MPSLRRSTVLRILYDGDLVQMVALSAPVMHPIVRVHMRSALQVLGITDHPHEGSIMTLRYPRSYAAGLDEGLFVGLQLILTSELVCWQVERYPRHVVIPKLSRMVCVCKLLW